MIRFALLAATTLAFAAPLAAQTATDAAQYVKMAGAGDLYEKESSQMILKDAKNPQVRAFATQMITDHNNSTKQVVAAAKQDGLTPSPPKLMPEQAKMIADLKKAKGPERERLYVQQQRTAHQKALDLHQTYAQSGDKPALKAAATQIAPVVQNHIQHLQSLGS